MPRLVVRPLQQFLRLEVSGGLVLLAATIAALLWANTAGASYDDLWSTELSLRVGGHLFSEDLRHLVNDGLMAIFFFVVGLEVKRELTVGELSTRAAALLPLFAAIGGMVLPALIFLAVMGGHAGSDGWGIPMATDVAFALCALAALGRRVPTALVAFLLGVAVIDDIGAILVVAFYYSHGIAAGWLAAAAGGIVLIVAAQRIGIRFMGVYVVLGLAVWLAVWESGVHATIAGVVLGLLTPVRPLQEPAVVSAEAIRIAAATADEPDDPDADAAHWRRLAWLSREAISPLAWWEHALHPWSSFVVIPIFALANAGIVFGADSTGHRHRDPHRGGGRARPGARQGPRPDGGRRAGHPPAPEQPAAGGRLAADGGGRGASPASASRSRCSSPTSPTPTPASWRRPRSASWRARWWPPRPASRSSSSRAGARAASAGDGAALLGVHDVEEALVAGLAREILAQQPRGPVRIVLEVEPDDRLHAVGLDLRERVDLGEVLGLLLLGDLHVAVRGGRGRVARLGDVEGQPRVEGVDLVQQAPDAAPTRDGVGRLRRRRAAG